MNALKNVNGFRNYNSKNIEKSIGEVIRCFFFGFIFSRKT